MRFHVIVTPEAQTGVRESFLYIHEQSPLNAARWLRTLYKKIETLARMPERCGSAREQEYLEEDLGSLSSNLTASSSRSISHKKLFGWCGFAMRSAAPSVTIELEK